MFSFEILVFAVRYGSCVSAKRTYVVFHSVQLSVITKPAVGRSPKPGQGRGCWKGGKKGQGGIVGASLPFILTITTL